MGYLVCASLGVGVANGLSRSSLSVTEVPVVALDLTCRVAGELGGGALADSGEGEVGYRLRGNSYLLCLLRGAVASAGDSKGHRVGACRGIGVRWVGASTRLSVAEVPLVALDGLSGRVGGRGAGELCRIACTHGGKGEVSRRHGVDDHFGGGAVGGTAYRDGAGVGAGHIQGAVRAGGVLLCRREAGRPRPIIGSPSLTIGA